MGSLGISLEVGDVLAKKYRIEGLIGQGGTGIVVAARHLQLDRPVAIKFLKSALASEEIRVRFEREARAIGKIESEHVVMILDAGTLADGEAYMVMEHLEGRDLAKVLKDDGPLPARIAVDCILQVCEALAEAHAAGIVHRDLKPANIFVMNDDDGAPQVKIVDFGIAKMLDKKDLAAGGGPIETTNAFAVLGSPRYMAPEQVRASRDVDERADLWSVGCVLYQALTGKHAFDAESNVVASVAVLTKPAPKLRDALPTAPPELEAIVTRCLEKDRNKRFQTARELAAALMPFASARRRESIERMRLAKSSPNIEIAAGFDSMPPPATQPLPQVGVPAAPISTPVASPGLQAFVAPEPHTAPFAPPGAPLSNPQPLSNPRPLSNPQPVSGPQLPAPASVPYFPAPGSGPHLPPPAPGSGPRVPPPLLAAGPAPASRTPIAAIAGAGILAVLLVVGVVAVAARALHKTPAAKSAPAAAQSLKSSDSLDAGRAHP